MSQPVWNGQGVDPWLPARLDAALDAASAERSVYAEVWGQLSAWLISTSRRLLRGPTIDTSDIFAQSPAWKRSVDVIIDKAIVPIMSTAYTTLLGQDFPWRDRPNFISYILGVRNRLVNTPNEVFDLVAGQIASGAMLGEGIAQLKDRVNQVLSTTDTPRWKNRAVTIARTECLLGDALVSSDGIDAVYRRWYEGPVFRIHMASGQQFAATPNHPILSTKGWIGFGHLLPGDQLVRNGFVQQLRTSTDENIGSVPARIGEIYDALATVGVTVRTKTGKPDFHGDGMDSYVDVATTNRELADRLIASEAKHVSHLGLKLAHTDHVCLPNFRDLLAVSSFSSAPHDSQRPKPSFNRIYADPKFLRKISSTCTFLIAGSQHVNIDIDPARASITPDMKLCVLGVAVAAQMHARFQKALLDSRCAASVFGGDAFNPISGFVGRDHVLAGQIGSARSANDFSVRGKRYPGVGKYGPNTSSVDAEILFNGIDAASVPVGVDKVVRVEVFPFSGHVYNLTTRRGWFNYGPLYSGNTIGALNASRADADMAFANENPDDEFERIWLATEDFRTRRAHREADGQRVGVTEPFIVGGEALLFPGDPTGSAENVINCRCRALLVEKGEELNMTNRPSKG